MVHLCISCGSVCIYETWLQGIEVGKFWYMASLLYACKYDAGDGWCNKYKFRSLDEAWLRSQSMDCGHEAYLVILKGKHEALIMIIGEIEGHDEDEEGYV